MSRNAAIPLVAALAALCCWAPFAAAGTVYKCTGADGKTYYSGQPCPAASASETLRVPEPASGDEAPAKPAGKSLDDRINEATDPVLKAQLQLQKQQCELARTQLDRYESAPYLVQQLDDGTQRRLSDEEAAAEKQRLRTLLETRCQ